MSDSTLLQYLRSHELGFQLYLEKIMVVDALFTRTDNHNEHRCISDNVVRQSGQKNGSGKQ